MGRKEKVLEVIEKGLADLIAVGRPLIADPELLEKWRTGREEETIRCGYCLQGCLHRLKNGQPLGCNLNPEIGQPPLTRTDKAMKVLVVGGGPAGMSTALYMSRRGHTVTLVERKDCLGGQFELAWKCPGKTEMKAGLEDLEAAVRRAGVSILLNTEANKELVKEHSPDLLVWATGAVQNIPDIPGLEQQYVLTSLEYLEGKEVRGPRILVIGAGRVGLEIAEKLGKEGYEVVATKRTDPIGSMMEVITRKLALMRIEKMANVTLMPHTAVKNFNVGSVEVEQDGVTMSLKPFQTVILASGMLPAPGPQKEMYDLVSKVEIIGDAAQVQDIFAAV
ncbi:MAG TPA: FAD-dependent oxidoreductase, partial [Desulfobacterales bacterium]|nr:FAD-dependent oxidoreductase [Desulfobacterales bacterium]